MFLCRSRCCAPACATRVCVAAGCTPGTDGITGTATIAGASGPLAAGRLCSATGLAAGTYSGTFTSTDSRWSSGAGSITITADCLSHDLLLGLAACPYFCKSAAGGNQLIGPTLHWSSARLGISCTLSSSSGCNYTGTAAFSYPGCGTGPCACAAKTVHLAVRYQPASSAGTTFDVLQVSYKSKTTFCGGFFVDCPDDTGSNTVFYYNNTGTSGATGGLTTNPFAETWGATVVDLLLCNVSGAETLTVSQ